MIKNIVNVQLLLYNLCIIRMINDTIYDLFNKKYYLYNILA